MPSQQVACIGMQQNVGDAETVKSADGSTKDLEAAHTVLLKSKLQDGTTMAEFERIGRGKVRNIPLIPWFHLISVPLVGLYSSIGFRRINSPSKQ